MVCDAALVVNLAVSAVMNGICCLHNMNEEEIARRENHEAIQNAIRVEWQRQRMYDKEQEDQLLSAVHHEVSKQLVEKRRTLLMEAKCNAAARVAATRQSNNNYSSKNIYNNNHDDFIDENRHDDSCCRERAINPSGRRLEVPENHFCVDDINNSINHGNKTFQYYQIQPSNSRNSPSNGRIRSAPSSCYYSKRAYTSNNSSYYHIEMDKERSNSLLVPTKKEEKLELAKLYHLDPDIDERTVTTVASSSITTIAARECTGLTGSSHSESHVQGQRVKNSLQSLLGNNDSSDNSDIDDELISISY